MMVNIHFFATVTPTPTPLDTPFLSLFTSDIRLPTSDFRLPTSDISHLTSHISSRHNSDNTKSKSQSVQINPQKDEMSLNSSLPYFIINEFEFFPCFYTLYCIKYMI